MNERKEIAYRGLKLRKASDGDGRSIEGVAVPFGDISTTRGTGRKRSTVTPFSRTPTRPSSATSTPN